MSQQQRIFNVDFEKKGYTPLELYSIKDIKLGKYMPPFFAQSLEDAKRTVANTVNYSNSLICKFPQDYELYHIALFDELSGVIAYNDGNVFVCNLKDLKSDDTIKFDELLKECKSLQMCINSALKDYDDKHAEYEKKLRELSILEDNIKTKYANKNDTDLFPIPESKKLALKKKRSILDLLTGN